MTKFDVNLRVTAKKLADVLANIGPDCELLGIIQHREKLDFFPHSPVLRIPISKVRYHGGLRNKGVSARQLALDIITQEPLRVWTPAEVGDRFVSNGFARGSAGVALSILKSERKILHLGEGKWCAQGCIIKTGAASNKGEEHDSVS